MSKPTIDELKARLETLQAERDEAYREYRAIECDVMKRKEVLDVETEQPRADWLALSNQCDDIRNMIKAIEQYGAL